MYLSPTDAILKTDPCKLKNVYLFSGLGADARVFQKLTFTYCNPVFINWITPQKKEPLTHYANRLCLQITEPNPILIGLSFGGMVAVEVAKLIPTEKVILINSAKTREELPPYFRALGRMRLQRFLPTSLAKRPNALTNWAFGATSPEMKALLAQILHDTDNRFLRWAIEQLICWKNRVLLPNTVHIHGTADHLIPIRFVKENYKIAGGGHLMLLDKAAAINILLEKIIFECG